MTEPGIYFMLTPEGAVVATDSLAEWVCHFEDPTTRKVAFDTVKDYEVSTVFLGIDHNFTPHGPPLLFETMVFPRGSMSDLYCRRYSTKDEAFVGHHVVVDCLRRGVTPENLEHG